MALLSFRLSIVFTIGLLLLNGFASDSSVLAFVNEEGPERLRLIAAPPSHVIVTGSRNAPVYLPCQAELGPETSDDIPNSSYGDEYLDGQHEEDDEEEEEDEGYDDEMEDDFLPHTSSLLTSNDLSNDEQHLQEGDGEHQQHQHSPRQYKNYENDENDERRRRRRRRRYVRTQRHGLLRGDEYLGGLKAFEYVWYRNGLEFLTSAFQNQNQHQTHKGFRLFENGTLRIPYNRQNGNMAAGVYRCMASLVNHQQRYHGSVLSTECTVSIAYLERDNRINFPNNTIVVRANEPTVLPCPFQSYPAANITWSVNKTVLQLHTNVGSSKENRFFLLQNGSLLISDVYATDSGRYRCNATNNYVTKNIRSTSVNLVVISIPPSSLMVEPKKSHLLPPLQPLQLSVRAGETLRLHCACYSCKPQWTFTPRQSEIPIRLENYTHQILFVNVSVERHEGRFTCSTPDGTDRQAFNVTVLIPPTIVSKIASYTSSVVASMAFNCSVTGNPMPTVTWYKNGRELTSNYIVHYNYPMLQINTLDPEDEGLYQCMARNAAGEISASSYLTIRDKQKYRHKAKRLDGIRCYPADTTSLYLTFTVPPPHASPNIEYVMYYLASDDPFRWYSSPPTQLAANGSLRISGKMVEPFRNYTVFLRACSVSDISGADNIRGGGTQAMQKVIPSRLSRGVRCASQGYPVLSTFFPNNGIFIWWPKYDMVQPTAFTIQLRHGGNSNLTNFTNQIIGTVDPLDDYMSHEEVQPLLRKVNAETKELQDWMWKEYDAADGSGAGADRSTDNLPHQQRRRRRQSRRENRRDRHAFDLSKDRKQIFDSLATSGAMDVDVPIAMNAAHLRSNASSLEALVAAATKWSVTAMGSSRAAVDSAQVRKTLNKITVTEVKVPGHVTGILLTNLRRVMVRVLGSVSTDGEPMVQDFRYVEWKMVDTDAPRADAVNKFQASHIDARSVQFTWSRFVATKAINRCLQLCYKNVNYDVTMRGGSNRFNCQKIPKDVSYYNVKDLAPVTMYKAFLKPCESNEALSDILDFQTKHDVPGPVTNHELHRKGGTITITWGPPENRNGILQGYLVEWINEDSVQHSANLSANAVSFTFPNVTSDERINISLRALSSSGLGIPIYLNLKNYEPIIDGVDSKGPGSSTSGYSERWVLKICLIGLSLLLLLVIFVLLYLLFRRKACKKATSSAGAPLNNRAPVAVGNNDARHPLATDASAMQMTGMITGCNNDMHEMQTLIRSGNSYPNANGGLMGNGLPLNTCGQSILPATNPNPGAALLSKTRMQARNSFDTATVNVPRNETLSSQANNTSGGCTTITSFKELLAKDRMEGSGKTFVPVVSNTSQRSSTVLDGLGERTNGETSLRNDIRRSSMNEECFITNGSKVSSKISDRIPLAALNRRIASDEMQSPAMSSTSKASCAVPPSSSSSPSSSCTSTPSSLSPASSQCVLKTRTPLEFDSSQRRLLETTLDSNTSTTNVEETKEQRSDVPAAAATQLPPPPTPPPPPHPVEIYDYDYATNCDDEREEERDHSRQLLLVQECRQVPENTTSPPPSSALMVTMSNDLNARVFHPTLNEQEIHLQCTTTDRRHQQPKPHNEANLNYHHIERTVVDTLRAEQGDGAYVMSNGVELSLAKNAQSYNRKSDKLDGDGADEDDDDDDDELDNSSSLLNTSSLSTKPLHQQNHTSSWNFRRPIIGPNG